MPPLVLPLRGVQQREPQHGGGRGGSSGSSREGDDGYSGGGYSSGSSGSTSSSSSITGASSSSSSGSDSSSSGSTSSSSSSSSSSNSSGGGSVSIVSASTTTTSDSNASNSNSSDSDAAPAVDSARVDNQLAAASSSTAAGQATLPVVGSSGTIAAIATTATMIRTETETTLPLLTTTSAVGPVDATSTPTGSAATSKSQLNVGALVGGICAAIVAGIIVGAFYLRRRRRRATQFQSANVHRSNKRSPYADDMGLMEEKSTSSRAPSISSGNSLQREPMDLSRPQRATIASGQTVAIPQSIFSYHSTPMFGEFEERYEKPDPQLYYPFMSPDAPEDVSNHSRRTSLGSNFTSQTPPLKPRRIPNLRITLPRGRIPADDFIDFKRSSISPFQESQYLAIAQKLRNDLPPLPTLEPLSDSPFADPEHSRNQETEESYRPRSLSAQSLSIQSVSAESITTEALKFPLPPTPSHTAVSRYRIDSSGTSMFPDSSTTTRVSLMSPLTTRSSKIGSKILSPGPVTRQQTPAEAVVHQWLG